MATGHALGGADAAGQSLGRKARVAAAGASRGRRLKATTATKRTGYLTEMERITSQGFSVLLSAPWYASTAAVLSLAHAVQLSVTTGTAWHSIGGCARCMQY
jgi:hypothetical protein